MVEVDIVKFFYIKFWKKNKTLYLTLVILEQGGSCCHLGPGFPLLLLVPEMLG